MLCSLQTRGGGSCATQHPPVRPHHPPVPPQWPPRLGAPACVPLVRTLAGFKRRPDNPGWPRVEILYSSHLLRSHRKIPGAGCTHTLRGPLPGCPSGRSQTEHQCQAARGSRRAFPRPLGWAPKPLGLVGSGSPAHSWDPPVILAPWGQPQACAGCLG